MSNLNTYIDPTTTTQVLESLSLAIDETKLIKEIDQLSQRLHMVESAGNQAATADFLKKKITVLEIELNYLRDRVNLN